MDAAVTITTVLMFFIGHYYVTKQHLGGFLVWASSNVLVAVFSMVKGDPCIACLFIVYGVANAYSMIMWGKGKGESSQKIAGPPPLTR